MKKQLLGVLLLVFLPYVAKAFPTHTNAQVFIPTNAVNANWDGFLWSWSGFDDQAIVADFKDILFTNAGLRLCYPARGTVYADYSGTNFVSVTYTAVVTEVLEYYTNCYGGIFWTNFYPAYSVTTNLLSYEQVDFYTNVYSYIPSDDDGDGVFTTSYGYVTLDTLSTNVYTGPNGYLTESSTTGRTYYAKRTITTNVISTATNEWFTNSAPACVVYTGNASVVTVPNYGIYTNRYLARTNSITSITNITYAGAGLYGSNLVANGNINSATGWFAFGITFTNGQAWFSTATSSLSQTFSTITTGQTYLVEALLYNQSASAFTMTVMGVTNTYTQDSSISTTITGVAAVGLTIKASTFVVAESFSIRPSRTATVVTNASSAVTTVFAASNNVYTAYPATQRTNNFYRISTAACQRVLINFNRTNLPPDGPYFGEFLAWEITAQATSSTRTLAKGQINVDHSLWGNTNRSTWTNPLANTVIGPPIHTLSTPYSGWPFPSAFTNIEAQSNWVTFTSPLLTIYQKTNYTAASTATQGLSSVLSFGTSAGTNNINMSGMSITNIGTNSLIFADGQSIASTNVVAWNAKGTGTLIASSLNGYATGTPLYVEAGTGTLIASSLSGYATGTPIYSVAGLATGTPLYVEVGTGTLIQTSLNGYATGTPVYVDAITSVGVTNQAAGVGYIVGTTLLIGTNDTAGGAGGGDVYLASNNTYSAGTTQTMIDVRSSGMVIMTGPFASGVSTASAQGTHAEGIWCNAAGNSGSHAEGYSTRAEGAYGSHSEGRETIARGGNGAHAEGYLTVSTGYSTHAEGEYTIAAGQASHAEGSLTRANAAYTHAGGSRSTATHENVWIWSDGTPIESTIVSQFVIQAANGMVLNGTTITVFTAAADQSALSNGVTSIGGVASNASTFEIYSNGTFVSSSTGINFSGSALGIVSGNTVNVMAGAGGGAVSTNAVLAVPSTYGGFGWSAPTSPSGSTTNNSMTWYYDYGRDSLTGVMGRLCLRTSATNGEGQSYYSSAYFGLDAIETNLLSIEIRWYVYEAGVTNFLRFSVPGGATFHSVDLANSSAGVSITNVISGTNTPFANARSWLLEGSWFATSPQATNWSAAAMPEIWKVVQ